jgi:pimeloyl-ACP methyl ester carboxylesterase
MDLAEVVLPRPTVAVASAQGDYDVRYRVGNCPFFFGEEPDAPTAAAISCGYLEVPQDRNRPDGLQIELAVAIIAAQNDRPHPDPILYLEGGPGGGALFAAEEWLDSALNREYTIILLDQRGTGFSWPNLGCPELEEVADDDDAFLAALRDCRTRLLDLGVELAHYHSAASAQDIADLRRALGIEQWNLLGVSYGTRLALTAMRDAPEGIRSVILDSVYPPNVNAYEEQALTFAGAIAALLQGCAADRACNAAYPDLAETFYALLEELDEEPLYFYADEIDAEEDVEVDAYTFLSVITEALYDTDSIPYLPQLIVDTYDGYYDLLLWDFLLVDEEDYGRQRPDDADLPDAASLEDAQGMFYAVECYEETPFADLDAAYDLAAGLHPLLADLLLQDVVQTLDACALWLAEQAPAQEAEPVHSDLPTLILAGEYDPVTPPAWARLAAETLPNHIYVELPRGGHGLTFADECITDIVLAFLADPSQAPRTRCIRRAVRPFVLP